MRDASDAQQVVARHRRTLAAERGRGGSGILRSPFSADDPTAYQYFLDFVGEIRGYVERTHPDDDLGPFQYGWNTVVRCWQAYFQHGLLPEEGGLLDQDPRLWDDIQKCNTLYNRAVRQWEAARAAQGLRK